MTDIELKNRIPTVAIVGRTNVGKSTLFNRLLGRRIAVVEDTPGVTRDRNYATVTRFNFPFHIVDTGGVVGEEDNPLQDLVRAQSEIGILEADLVIALFDGLHGLHPLDAEVSDLLRRSGKPVIWVSNKCESEGAKHLSNELHSLGIDKLITISAAHNLQIYELIAEIETELSKLGFSMENALESVEPPAKPIGVAILGRPNVGKSTLINRIIGEDRLVTSPISGTTRDTIDLDITREGESFRILDTAGLRKKAKVEDGTIERFSNLRTLKALVRSDVVVLALDATEGGATEQDAKLAGIISERGKGLIILINKWDAIEKDNKSVKQFTDLIRGQLKFVQYAPILFVSALTGRRCPSVLQMASKVYHDSRRRIPTPELNRLLRSAFEKNPPPRYRATEVKLYFAVQVDVAPPTFALFVNYPRKVNASYQRYIKNSIRDAFGFEGTDIKLFMRKREKQQDSHQRAAQ